jgi:amino-acid N-acetyltransferase
VAAAAALALGAVKLIFITTRDGIEVDGVLLRQMPVQRAEEILRAERGRVHPPLVSKLEHACLACKGGVERVHIINGRMEEGLLAEVFSSQGVGSLVHVDEYEAIRRAVKKDARLLLKLIGPSMANEEVLPRSRSSIEKQIQDFYVFEIDRQPVGCVALHPFPEEGKAELACLVVSPFYGNRGIGRKLMAYVEREARERGFRTLFALSTQAASFFQRKGGFEEAPLDTLPASRRQQWEQSRRNSRVLVKRL